MKKEVDGSDLTDTERLLQSLTGENDKGRKQLKEALEIVRDKRLAEERHSTLIYMQRVFIDEVNETLKTLRTDEDKADFLRKKQIEYQRLSNDKKGTYRIWKRTDIGAWLESSMREVLNRMKQEQPEKSKAEDVDEIQATKRNPEFTTARQVLAIHYLLQYRQATQASNADVARFIEFLTGKNYKNIYKRVCNPLGSRDKELTEDLRFIRALFEKLGLNEIVKMINNEINSGSF